MLQIRKYLKITAVILIVVLTYFISQVIYEYSNTPRDLAKKALFVAYKTSSLSSLKPTIFFMDLASSLHIKDKNPLQSSNASFNFVQIASNINPDTRNQMLNYLKGSLGKTYAYNFDTLLARDYYYLGVIAYNNHYPDSAVSFFKKMISLRPESSFLYMELAKLYLSENKVNDAKDILEYCQKYQDAAVYCRDFANKVIPEGDYGKVGDLSEWIDKHLNTP